MSKMDGAKRRGPHGIENEEKPRVYGELVLLYILGTLTFSSYPRPNPVPCLAVPSASAMALVAVLPSFIAMCSTYLASRTGQTNGLFFTRGVVVLSYRSFGLFIQ